MFTQLWKLLHARIERAEFLPRDQGHTYFFPPDGSNVRLPLLAPVNFHELTPGLDPEVLAQSNPLHGRASFIQSSPAANFGVLAVCSNDPLARNRRAVQQK